MVSKMAQAIRLPEHRRAAHPTGSIPRLKATICLLAKTLTSVGHRIGGWGYTALAQLLSHTDGRLLRSCRDSLYPQFMMSYPDAELAMLHAAPEEGKAGATKRIPQLFRGATRFKIASAPTDQYWKLVLFITHARYSRI